MRSGDWPAACHIGRSAALPANHHCAVGLLPLPGKEFRQLKLILHSELRRRAASRRALPCPSSLCMFFNVFYKSEKTCFYVSYSKINVFIIYDFQYFWAMAGPPKRRGARENFHSFPSLSMGLQSSWLRNWKLGHDCWRVSIHTARHNSTRQMSCVGVSAVYFGLYTIRCWFDYFNCLYTWDILVISLNVNDLVDTSKTE